MIGFVIRLAFWGCLLVAVLPGARKSGVYNGDISIETVARAAQATLLDLSNFCSRNGGVCQTGSAAIAEVSAKAKTGFLAAYDGLTEQNEEPDRHTITSSVRPKNESQP